MSEQEIRNLKRLWAFVRKILVYISLEMVTQPSIPIPSNYADFPSQNHHPPPLYRRRRVVVKTGYSSTYFPGRVSYGLQSRPLAIASQYLPLTPATPYPDGRGKGKLVLRYNSLQARRIKRIKRLRVECTSDKKNNRKEPCARKRLLSGEQESEDSLVHQNASQATL